MSPAFTTCLKPPVADAVRVVARSANQKAVVAAPKKLTSKAKIIVFP